MASNKALIAIAVGCGCLVVFLAVAGIVAAILIPNLVDSMEKAKQKRTIADIRTVGTAWLSWLADQEEPGTWAGSESPSAAEMAEILVPDYVREVPVTDGWGHEIRYTVSRTKFASEIFFTVTSPGRDGLFEDPPPKNDRPFPATEYDYDIVWQDGVFVSYPEAGAP